ncbi:MAG: 6-pyruvoyl-tetrahydropterin synthase-related protein [Anaerolineae bacterium]
MTKDRGLLLAGLVALFVIQPLLRPGLPATADTPIHLYRALEFAHSWGPGVMYPRWAPHLAYGYGYPLWNFAPPLPYLIPLAFYALGASLEAGVKGLIALAALLYAGGAYLWVRHHLGARAGLVAAAIYTLAPFALREALLYGGNYPQYLAIGLYPWVLWALDRLNRRQNRLNVALLGGLYGAAMLSHLFHALALAPVTAAYAVLNWWAGERRARRQLAAPALAMALALLWTAFFWLPAFIERRVTRATGDVYLAVSPLFARFLNWGELLALPHPLDARAANPWVPFSLGVGALALAALGGAALALAGRARPLFLRRGLFFLALLAATVFMVLPASRPVWAAVPLLGVAEFPWRLLGLANLSLAFLGALSVHLFGRRAQTAAAAGGELAVLLSSMVYLYPWQPFVHYGERLADMTAYELATRTTGTTTLGEYLPRTVRTVPTTSPLADALRRGQPIEKLDRAALPPDAGAQLLAHTPTTDGYHFDSPQPFTARFFTFYFPGWKATLDGEPVDIQTEPDTGLMTVLLPAGNHTLRLAFGDTPLRSAAAAASLLALAGAVLFSVRRMARPSKTPAAPKTAPQRNARWAGRPALAMGALLAGLLLVKWLAVDPRSNWFRTASPPGQVNGAQHALRVNLNDQFWLLGYDVQPERPRPGDTLRVVLYWQAARPPEADYRSFAHLDAPAGERTWAMSDNAHPGDATAQIEIPTSGWDTARYVRDEHFVTLPAHTPPVTFNLRAGLYNPLTGRRLPIAGGEGDTITLQAVPVAPPRRPPTPDIAHPLDFRVGESIHLLGYDWAPGERRLTLYWQAGQQPEADFIVFVHLLDETGQQVWGADSPPLDGLYPTSAWQPNLPVVDSRSLALPDLSPGGYSLSVGMYHPGTLARLPVTDAAGRPVAENAVRLELGGVGD